ncbi:integrase [Chania multitudinisentens RB-25]|uniref:Integrase n=1 Tax=Chania multitudinisentens RB-25 TaxID=1441930 RepID=W0LJI0_9GAMM|nr:tyrosine-type recombinase/integrase [Chania multitudinisentens]AHG22155.1 integrase [Chania multitudinisentens RB-25]
MAKRPTRYDANLPKNLTYRRKYRSFYWRHPITRKELPLGQIARRDAVGQAIEANNYLEQNYLPSTLIERIKGREEVLTLGSWLERYEVILDRRDLKPNTIKIRGNQLKMIRSVMGEYLLSEIDTRQIAEYLESFNAQGKGSMSTALRSVLSDIFREAIVEGRIKTNPVEPTKAPRLKVKRERLNYDEFKQIYLAAREQPQWVGLAMEIDLITGQRREDVVLMRFTDIFDGRLHIEQGKTGMRLAIPLDLRLEAANLCLGEVIERCRSSHASDYIINTTRRSKNGDTSLHPDTLTKAFVKARNATKLDLGDNPPTFHEIRSLASRLYSIEKGEEFAQRLLGHKSAVMTKKYLDPRGKEYVLV